MRDFAAQSDEEDGEPPGPGPRPLPPMHEPDGSEPPRPPHPAGGDGGDRMNGFTMGRRRSTPSPERPASFPLVDYDDDDDSDDAAAADGGGAPPVPVSWAWVVCHLGSMLKAWLSVTKVTDVMSTWKCCGGCSRCL